MRANVKYGGNKAAAQAIGKLLAEKAIAAGIKEVASTAATTSITAASPRWPMRPAKPD